MTGTPVQNNLHEFGALLSFLAPNVFTDLSLFDAAFNLRVTTNHKKHHNKSDEEEGGTNFSSVLYFSVHLFPVLHLLSLL